MNDWTASQIRELVKVEICAERRFRDALRIEDKRELEEYKKNAAQALLVEASVREQRLTVLNHAHEDARKVQQTLLQITVFSAFLKEFQEWKERVDRDIASRASALSIFASAIALLISVFVAITSYVK